MTRPTTRADATRVHVLLPPTSHDRLLRLQDSTEASSLSEVVVRALRVYDVLLRRMDEGDELVLRTPRGHETKLLLLP